MTPSSKKEKSGQHDESRTRRGKKGNVKKRFDIDEDMNEVKVVSKPRKSKIVPYFEDQPGSVDAVSNTQSDNVKESMDLSKYKDEYKHLIQSVKKNISQKTCIRSNSKANCKVLKEGGEGIQQLVTVQELCKDDSGKQSSSMDVFQVMMEARKKSIGMNSPGKELAEDSKHDDIVAHKEVKAKRILALSALAEKKGASKRRELEELRDENNRNRLQKRAKSFKKMLQQGSKTKVQKIHIDKLKEGIKDYEDIFMADKTTKGMKKRRRDSLSKCESDDIPLKKSKLQSASAQRDESNKSTLKRESKMNSTLLSEDEENFLKKLSPSLKKSESVLSYFGKVSVEPENREPSEEIEKNENRNNILKVKFTPKAMKKKKNLHNKKSFKTEKEPNTKNDLIDNAVSNNEPINAGKDCHADNISDIVTTNPERPRRIIRKPVKYMQDSSEDYLSSNSDNEDMFEVKNKRDCNRKTKEKNKNKENVLTIEIDDKVSPLKIINLQSPGQLKCIKSPKTLCNTSDKLAPLFRKSLPKPKMDPSIMEARRLFLQSGIPENIKKHFEKPVCNIIQDINEFVPVYHVQQRSGNSELHIWNLPTTKYMPDISEYILDVCSDVREESYATLYSKKNLYPSTVSTVTLFNKLETYNLKQGLKDLKQTNLNFPVYKTFKQLWDKSITSRKSSKISSQDSGGLIGDLTNTTSDSNNVNCSVWTEKYKPQSSHDIIGNFQAISSIKKWLESWKEYNETSASKIVKKPRRDSSSSSDFDLSDSESRDSSRSPSNVMIVTGPPGSGKTSSIYAISNELGINVLEVNASSRRTGKKILSDMHEATQSHKVLTKHNSEQNFSGLFAKVTNGTPSKSEPKLLNQSKQNNKLSKEKKTETDSGFISNNESNVMSIMLIDDVDIVFEEDDGFISALSQLVQSSKRPLFLVASDENCSHLQRFRSDSNMIKFGPLSGKILGPWLDIMVLIECNKIIPRLSANLLESNKGDVRKSILQLQYWILGTKTNSEDNLVCSSFYSSEGYSDDESNASWIKSDCSSSKVLTPDVVIISKIKKTLLSELSKDCNLDRAWWSLNSLLKDKENSDNVCDEDKNKTNQRKRAEDMENLYKYIDTYSVIDLMQSHIKYVSNGCVVPPWHRTLKDSLSESENMMMYENHANLFRDWYQYVQEHSKMYVENMLGDTTSRDDIAYIESLDIRAQERRLKIYEDFHQGVSFASQLDRSSVSMDYMATLRCMCRSEKSRSSSNLKRNNRFHNYLNTLNISSNNNILNNACKIFSD